MGEHQCAFCGHIQTGFEDQDWKDARNALIEECAQAVDRSRTIEQWNVDAHQTRFSILKTIRALKSE